MKVEHSVTDDDDICFDDEETDNVMFEVEPDDSKVKHAKSADVRRRIEEMMEEKWLRHELGDLDSY